MNNMLNNEKVLYSCKPVKDIKFPKSYDFISISNKRRKIMNNIIIRPDKYTIYQISEDDIVELKHIPEQDVEGFAICPTTNISDMYIPKYHHKEEWYAILKGGKKIDLTKKQYNIIKGWFKGE